MDYARHYSVLIERARNRKLSGYYETHHVIPRCMGGSNAKENLVDLTPEEHFMAHKLLVKLHPDHWKLALALIAMSWDRDGVKPNNKLFGWARRRANKALSVSRTGIPRPGWVREKIGAAHRGRRHSDEQKARISAALKGKKKSSEHNAKVSAALTGRRGSRLGLKTPVETRMKQRAAALGRKHTRETLRKLRDHNAKLTPEQSSARAHKAWETKRLKKMMEDQSTTV